MVENGFSPDDFASNIKSKIEKNLIETSDDLIKNIYWNLKKYICDSHFVIVNNNSAYNFNAKFYEQSSGFSNEFVMAINKNSIYLNLPGFLPDFFSKESKKKTFLKKYTKNSKASGRKNI